MILRLKDDEIKKYVLSVLDSLLILSEMNFYITTKW